MAVARELCEEHDRCDTLDVARYYASLTDDELQRGLAYEARYRELFGRVVDARRRGLKEHRWLEERADILVQLAVLAAESGADADHAPAGRALSFSALLRAESLEDRGDRGSLSFLHELSSGRDEAARALAIFEDVGQLGPQLEALWVAGRLDRLAGARREARASFERCLSLSALLGYDVYGERALIELLRLARELGDTRAREELLDRLLELRSPEECWPLVREYADWLFQDDRPEEAEAILLRYPPPADENPTSWRVYLGDTALRAGDRERYEEQLRWLEEHEASSRTELLRAEGLLAEGRPEEVVRSLGGGALELDFDPRAEAIGRSLLGQAQAELGAWSSATRELERALGIAEVYRSRLDESEHNVFGEWIGLHTVTLAALAEAKRGNPLEAARIVEDFQSRTLREARAAKLGQPAEHLSVDALLGWADDYELGCITWAVGADLGVAVHVAPSSGELDAAWAGRIEPGRRALRGAARRLREAVVDGRETEAAALAREIAGALLPQPLRERLRRLAGTAKRPRLLVLVHGPVERLPIELLFEANGGLGFELVPVVLPGLPEAAAPLDPPEFAALEGWTLAAGEASADLPRLPAAHAEIEALSALHPDAVVAEGPGALAEVERALEEDRPLHLAAHLVWGCACTRTRLAPLALMLGPGAALCSHRVAELAPSSPLVVLSACETAAGRYVDAEGLAGLTRAFLESGTRNLLVTSWPVDDAAARDFALDFHRALAGGAPPSVAAFEARAKARERGVPEADWAAFRSIGVD